MLTLDTYGHGGRTSAAYYVRGIAANTAKLANSVGVIEMAWVMGLTPTPPLGSNLSKNRLQAYANVQSANRFTFVLGSQTLVVPSITGKRANVSPLDLIWTVYH